MPHVLQSSNLDSLTLEDEHTMTKMLGTTHLSREYHTPEDLNPQVQYCYCEHFFIHLIA